MPDKFDDDEISKLLRLKRYEQPAPEYFENFLKEFHHRQRAELLREPLWKIARDRVVAFFTEQTASRWAYGAATAVVLLSATAASVNILDTPRGGDFVASADVSGNVAPRVAKSVAPDSWPRVPTQLAEFSPNAISPNQLPVLNEQFSKPAVQSVAASSSRPRYVMDARPVSYEAASSF